jgi:hypothetical protein
VGRHRRASEYHPIDPDVGAVHLLVLGLLCYQERRPRRPPVSPATSRSTRRGSGGGKSAITHLKQKRLIDDDGRLRQQIRSPSGSAELAHSSKCGARLVLYNLCTSSVAVHAGSLSNRRRRPIKLRVHVGVKDRWVDAECAEPDPMPARNALLQIRRR